MREKIFKCFRLCKSAKKTGMFFAAFVLTVAVMCASFTEVRGDMTGADETARTNAKVQILGTEYAAAAVAEQTVAAVHATVQNSPDKQVLTADDGKNGQIVLADAQAKPVPIKLSAEENGADGQAAAKKDLNIQTAVAGKKEQAEGFVYSEKIPLNRELQEYTFQRCSELGLEYELVLAVMWRESRFDSNALHLNSNGTFDSGLMQINDINKKWLNEKRGIDNLMDPYQNIDAGTAILGDLYEKYGEHGAMLAYQYGEAGMVRKVNQGVTTSRAVEAAYRQREYYRKLI